MLLACAALFACQARPVDAAITGAATANAEAAEGAAPGISIRDMLAPYPRARWRLVPMAELANVLLFPSHILIRHEQVDVLQAHFGLQQDSSEPPPTRSRAEARALAFEVARQARAEPEHFTELVARYSEDALTRSSGGSLGALLALTLRPWPQVLDAFAALRPQEVSDVVETDQGFHIFLRRSPPEERTLSGSHIVIGYDDAAWLRDVLARGPVPRRSRAEALALANELYERARAAPGEFEALVAQYSEHLDAGVQGDFGTWSTRGYGAYSRQVELLAGLPVRGVAPPIDSIVGFQIVMRTADRPRRDYAAIMLRLEFDPEAPTLAPLSPKSVREQASGFAKLLQAEPQRFDDLVARHCCAVVQRFTHNEDPRPVALAIQDLPLGAIAAKPFEFHNLIEIPKRVDPALADPDRAYSLELPSAAGVDLHELALNTARQTFAGRLDTAAQQAQAELGFTPELLTELRAAQTLDLGFDEAGERRPALIDAAFARVDALLGRERGARYLAFVRQQLEAELLGPGAF